jgi:hypothetical protein
MVRNLKIVKLITCSAKNLQLDPSKSKVSPNNGLKGFFVLSITAPKAENEKAIIYTILRQELSY